MQSSREASDGSNLEGVDISVHCDIHIFSWLMDWGKLPLEVICIISLYAKYFHAEQASTLSRKLSFNLDFGFILEGRSVLDLKLVYTNKEKQ